MQCETIGFSTLRFASTCKKVVNRVMKNQIRSKDALITRYESMIQDLQVRLKQFDSTKINNVNQQQMARAQSSPSISHSRGQ